MNPNDDQRNPQTQDPNRSSGDGRSPSAARTGSGTSRRGFASMDEDRQRAIDFVAKTREKMTVSIDPKARNRAYLIVGNEDWPFPFL